MKRFLLLELGEHGNELSLETSDEDTAKEIITELTRQPKVKSASLRLSTIWKSSHPRVA